MATENIEVQITEISGNLATTHNHVAYYKYRYTFPKDDELEYQKTTASRMVKHIVEHFSLDGRYTAGIEHFTKGMQACKPHVHIHFLSKHKSDTIRKNMARTFEMIGRCQACIAEVLVDEDKFFRYPLKQQDGESRRWSSYSKELFTKEQVIAWRDVAYACWLQSAEVLVGKLEKKIERTTEDRLFHQLDRAYELDEECFKTYYEVLKYGLAYWAEHELTFNYSTICGYVDKYLLSRGKMSYDKYLEMKGAKNIDLN